MRVARRDVGIFRVLADGRQDLPGARAFGAAAFSTTTATPGDVVEPERVGGRLALLHLIVRGDADFGEIDVEQRRQHVAVGDIDQRRGLERRADVLGGALEFQRAGDDAADVADGLPFRGQRVVAEVVEAVREQRQMHRRLGIRPVHRARLLRR